MKQFFIVLTIIIIFGIACYGKKKNTITFDRDFLFGVATSAYQIEGNNVNSDYWSFEQMGKTEDLSKKACNSWELWQEDNQLVEDLGVDVYRISIEWSRIEPEKGSFDTDALNHYIKIIEDLTDRGIRPVVTLHHFTNPIWLNDPEDTEEHPGWKDAASVEEFKKYVEFVVSHLKDRVDLWITINEPVVYVLGAYGTGNFPPGDKSIFNLKTKIVGVLKNLIEAHVESYKIIKDIDTEDADGDGIASMVGIAKNSIYFYPANPQEPLDVDAANRLDDFYNLTFPRAVIEGMFDEEMDGLTDQDLHKDWVNKLDFLGINYYTSDPVVYNSAIMKPVDALMCDGMIEKVTGISLSDLGCPDVPYERSDNGMNIVPEGLYRILRKLNDSFGLPLIITENGIATTDDNKRIRYIISHLQMIEMAINDGIDVFGYIHWSLMDNYEWGSFDPRFGLYRTDYNTFDRNPTGASSFYSEMVKKREITEKMLEKWPPFEVPTLP